MKEVWKDVVGYENKYKVSNLGRVYSIERNGTKGHFCKEKISYGYSKVCLVKKSKIKLCALHRLVAIAFIPNPNNYPQVNHIDGNKQNNNVDNLEWVTAKQNMEHAYKTGLKKAWSYRIAQIKDDKIIKMWENAVVASKETGIYIRSIYRSANFYHKNRKAGGFKWTYEKDLK